jgi:hypothetical protein
VPDVVTARAGRRPPQRRLVVAAPPLEEAFHRLAHPYVAGSVIEGDGGELPAQLPGLLGLVEIRILDTHSVVLAGIAASATRRRTCCRGDQRLDGASEIDAAQQASRLGCTRPDGGSGVPAESVQPGHHGTSQGWVPHPDVPEQGHRDSVVAEPQELRGYGRTQVRGPPADPGPGP